MNFFSPFHYLNKLVIFSSFDLNSAHLLNLNFPKLSPINRSYDGKIKHLDSRQFNDYVIRRNWLLLFESQFDTRLFLRVTCAQHSSVEHLFSVFLFLLHTTVPVCYISLSLSLSVVCCLFVLYVCGAVCQCTSQYSMYAWCKLTFLVWHNFDNSVFLSSLSALGSQWKFNQKTLFAYTLS